MLVADLIKELKKYPRDALLLIDGYEGGYQDPQAIGIYKVYIDEHNDTDYFGKYEKDESGSNDSTVAVIIERYNEAD